MFNAESLEIIIRERRHDGFVRPDYGRFSLAEVPTTLAAILGSSSDRPTLPAELWHKHAGVRRVLCLLVDGFGLDQFLDYRALLPTLQRIEHAGDVHALTSVFPSTTPAALTTMHTGLTPQEHGLPEWTVFFEEIDEIIETLPFRVLLTPGRDTLLEAGGHPEMLYDGSTIYEHLARAGVESSVFVFHEYAHSVYSRATQKGAHVTPYVNVLDLMQKLVEHLEIQRGPGYDFVYWGAIDSALHQFGPGSREHIAALRLFFEEASKELFERLSKAAAKDVLLVVLADHGHAKVDPSRVVYLNRYLELERYYSRRKSQDAIVPTGGPNDVFLFIDPARIPDTLRLLAERLGDRAVVLETADALQQGLFGLGVPTPQFRRRIGDVLILPRAGNHVWYEHRPNSPFEQLGCHGGLTDTEMLVPLAMCPLEALVG
ncbi:MAG TPA: alkaline phosphatase family protein [Enhygromyxa sp.]|nr:alkaline phosphatase family protein [Enhygromyxa sp.]